MFNHRQIRPDMFCLHCLSCNYFRFILGILLNVFPDEVETFFKQFAPPQIPVENNGVESPSNNKDSIKAERLHNPQPGKVQR